MKTILLYTTKKTRTWHKKTGHKFATLIDSTLSVFGSSAQSKIQPWQRRLCLLKRQRISAVIRWLKCQQGLEYRGVRRFCLERNPSELFWWRSTAPNVSFLHYLSFWEIIKDFNQELITSHVSFNTYIWYTSMVFKNIYSTTLRSF